VHRALVDLIDTEKPYDLTFEINPADGTEPRVITSYAKLIRDESGKAVSVMGVIQDITDRHKAEIALRENESMFRAIFEQAAMGVALLNSKTGAFVRINKKYCSMLGYSVDEMLNKSFMDITYPSDIKSNIDFIANLIAGNGNEYTFVKRYVRKDDTVFWGNLTILFRARDVFHALPA